MSKISNKLVHAMLDDIAETSKQDCIYINKSADGRFTVATAADGKQLKSFFYWLEHGQPGGFMVPAFQQAKLTHATEITQGKTKQMRQAADAEDPADALHKFANKLTVETDNLKSLKNIFLRGAKANRANGPIGSGGQNEDKSGAQQEASPFADVPLPEGYVEVHNHDEMPDEIKGIVDLLRSKGDVRVARKPRS